MRDLHRLPPLLHIMNIVGYVFPLAAIVLFVMSYIQAFSMSAADSDRLRLVALNLVLLSMVGLIVARVYKTRIYQPDRRPLPLDSWRSQARAPVAGRCATLRPCVGHPSASNPLNLWYLVRSIWAWGIDFARRPILDDIGAAGNWIITTVVDTSYVPYRYASACSSNNSA